MARCAARPDLAGVEVEAPAGRIGPGGVVYPLGRADCPGREASRTGRLGPRHRSPAPEWDAESDSDMGGSEPVEGHLWARAGGAGRSM
jgi:hypothetical protein